MEICLTGLKKFLKQKKVEEELSSLGDYQIAGVKKKPKDSFAFVRFASEEAKEKFLAQFPEKVELSMGVARIRAVHKEKTENSKKIEKRDRKRHPKDKSDKPEGEEKVAEVSLVEKICPFYHLPRDEQIRIKEVTCHRIFEDIKKFIVSKNKNPEFIRQSWLKEKETSCLRPILSLSNVDGIYRNKCEFTISDNGVAGEVHIGFVMSVDRDRNLFLTKMESGLPIVSPSCSGLVFAFERFLLDLAKENPDFAAKLVPFNYAEKKGCFRNLVVRQSEETREIALKLVANIEEEEQEFREFLFGKLREFCAGYPEKIASMSVEKFAGGSNAVPNDPSKESHIFGEYNFIVDRVLGLHFIVSVSGFFQVHTRLAELLYDQIRSLLKVDENTIFLDICAGTGTIGIICGQNASQIYFIEPEKGACDLIEKNLRLNQFLQASPQPLELALPAFLAEMSQQPSSPDQEAKPKGPEIKVFNSKIEECIDEICLAISGTGRRVVAVVDPPRAGLHPSVAQALRTFRGLDELVYVSCDLNQVKDNLSKLCDEEKKTNRGPPFSPLAVIPVDIFPHTKHFETLIHLKRLYE